VTFKSLEKIKKVYIKKLAIQCKCSVCNNTQLLNIEFKREDLIKKSKGIEFTNCVKFCEGTKKMLIKQSKFCKI